MAASLNRDYPLTETDVKAIVDNPDTPEALARELIERFSPRWLLGWRDVCRANDERTLICGTAPRAAMGHKFQLLFPKPYGREVVTLNACLDSFVVDYCARQKLGGTSFSYFVIRQLPVIAPTVNEESLPFLGSLAFRDWLTPRMLELVYTASDLVALARDCGYNHPPFRWDDERRFEIRCELDAAFFHLYMRCDATGLWFPTEAETPAQLAALKSQFPAPRDAVAYILDQFPLIRQRDERAHGGYRTKDRILAIYDAMLAAQRSGRPFQTTLNPPPGGGAK